MRYLSALIVVPLAAATMIACSQLNPAAPTKGSEANISPVATSFAVSPDVQTDAGTDIRIISGQLTVRSSPVTRISN